MIDDIFSRLRKRAAGKAKPGDMTGKSVERARVFISTELSGTFMIETISLHGTRIMARLPIVRAVVAVERRRDKKENM